MGSQAILLATAALAAGLTQAAWNFDTTTQGKICTDDQQTAIKAEFLWASRLAIQVQQSPTFGAPNAPTYLERFFSPGNLALPDFTVSVSNVFSRMINQLDETNTDYTFTITCDPTTDLCQNPLFLASMKDKSMVMNFCNSFFNLPAAFKSSDDFNNKCHGTDTSDIDLRMAQRTRSIVIIHELTHTTFAMDPLTTSTLDMAYGFNGCFQFPLGKFDRSCVPYAKPDKILCPKDPNDPSKGEGICAADRALNNADSWAHFAAGVGWSKQCYGLTDGSAIPLPKDLPKRAVLSSRHPRRDMQKRGDGEIGKCAGYYEDDSYPIDAGPGDDFSD